MIRSFEAKTHILSGPQQKLWNELGDQLPKHWVLYGDTALGLRMGHRPSLNFEFKSAKNFNPEYMRESVPFLRDATVMESRWNYLKVGVGGPTPVEMTFTGGETIAQVLAPERAGNGLAVASLPDLAGEKMFRMSQKMTERDCRDMSHLLHEGVYLNDILGFAKAQYRELFDENEALKNITSIDRSNARIEPEAESRLISEGSGAHLPVHTRIHSERITTEVREPSIKVRQAQNFERAVDPYDLHDPFDRPRRDPEL